MGVRGGVDECEVEDWVWGFKVGVGRGGGVLTCQELPIIRC